MAVTIIALLTNGVVSMQTNYHHHPITRLNSSEIPDGKVSLEFESLKDPRHVFEEPVSFTGLLARSSYSFAKAFNDFDSKPRSTNRWQEWAPKNWADPFSYEGPQAKHWDWEVLAIFTVFCFGIDVFIMQRFMHGFWAHCVIFAFWGMVAVLYNIVVLLMHGTEMCVMWWTAYFFEWLLNVDNLFIFIMVFSGLRTPSQLRPNAMLYWIPGAVVLRIVLFTIIEDAFEMCFIVKIACGVLLMYSGYEASKEEEDEDVDIESFKIIAAFKWVLGERACVDYDEDGGRMFIVRNGKYCATRLLLVVFALNVIDFFFVFDSVAAKVAQIPVQYVANSAEVVALFGMRSFMIFLEDIVEAFELLKYGICVILAWLGLQLIVSGIFPHFFRVTPMQSVVVIMMILAVSIVASAIKGRSEGRKGSKEASN